jgi:hypothetical protein
MRTLTVCSLGDKGSRALDCIVVDQAVRHEADAAVVALVREHAAGGEQPGEGRGRKLVDGEDSSPTAKNRMFVWGASTLTPAIASAP